MKRGYKKLLILELIIFVILLLNSLIVNILSGYKIIILLFLLTFVFKYFFGIEKDKHRYLKDIILEIIIFLIIFFISYYLLGIVIGFARTGNYFTISGIKNFIFPTICYVILKEFLRYQFMCKSEGNKLAIIVTIILFIFLDLTLTIQYINFSNRYSIFKFIALNLLPTISRNITFSYITSKVGYKPIIIYALIIELYQYIIPIVPNPNTYLVSIIEFLLPIILGYKIYLFFKKVTDEEIDRNYKKKKSISLVLPTLIIIIIVYFTSGEFHYWTLAIASGSMSTSINKGDIVIVEKINNKYDNLKEGQVIAYEKDGIILVHRIVNIIKYQDKYYFYTKGDANESIDNFIIEEDMIIGIVNHKISYIGLPTVWLKELWEGK